MNEEQLLSFINYKLSEVSSMTALRDVVAIVVEAKQRVEAAEAKVAQADLALTTLKESAAAVEAALNLKRSQALTQIEQDQQESEARYNAYLIAKKEECDALAATYTAHEESCAAIVDEMKTLVDQRTALTQQKQDLEADVATVQAQLKAIKESIR